MGKVLSIQFNPEQFAFILIVLHFKTFFETLTQISLIKKLKQLY